jgi:hypothetical protein
MAVDALPGRTLAVGPIKGEGERGKRGPREGKAERRALADEVIRMGNQAEMNKIQKVAVVSRARQFF